MNNQQRGYIILTRKGNFYNWEIIQSKEVGDSYIAQLESMGFDCIITTKEVELNFNKQ
jgi:hypothetical protein